jgi:hypothetical protein
MVFSWAGCHRGFVSGSRSVASVPPMPAPHAAAPAGTRRPAAGAVAWGRRRESASMVDLWRLQLPSAVPNRSWSSLVSDWTCSADDGCQRELLVTGTRGGGNRGHAKGERGTFFPHLSPPRHFASPFASSVGHISVRYSSGWWGKNGFASLDAAVGVGLTSKRVPSNRIPTSGHHPAVLDYSQQARSSAPSYTPVEWRREKGNSSQSTAPHSKHT